MARRVNSIKEEPVGQKPDTGKQCNPLKYSKGRRSIWSSEAQKFLPWGPQPPWIPDKNADSG